MDTELCDKPFTFEKQTQRVDVIVYAGSGNTSSVIKGGVI
jgi:hypothetical protein